MYRRCHRRRAVGRCVGGRCLPSAPQTRWRRKRGFTNSGGDPVERVTGLRVGNHVVNVNDSPTSVPPSTVLAFPAVPRPTSGF